MSTGRRSSGTLDMMLMSLLVTSKSVSGYEFATMLREPVPFIWPVKHSQIYPALAGLERRGDLLGEWVEQRGRPNKKVYTLSDQGRERLRAWLLEPRAVLSQDEVMLIAYNIALIGREAVERALAVYRRQCELEKTQLEERWQQVAEYGYKSEEVLVGIRASTSSPSTPGTVAWPGATGC